MRILIDFYNDECGEIKLGAVIMFIIGICLLYIFWDKVEVYINKLTDLDNFGFK